MNDSELRQIVYMEMLDRICHLYGLKAEREHECIYEMYEGEIPVFKLLLVQKDDGSGFIIMSFHIDVEAAIAIQWFLRVRQLDPNLQVTTCYMRDSNGASYVGEDALLLKMYTVEQEIITNFIASDKDPEDIVDRGVTKETPKPNSTKTYSDYSAAITAFDRLIKKDGDIEH